MGTEDPVCRRIPTSWEARAAQAMLIRIDTASHYLQEDEPERRHNYDPQPVQSKQATSMEPATLIDNLQQLIAEEMHLLGQELEDSLDGYQSARLDPLTQALDIMDAILAKRQRVRPGRE